MSLPFSESVFKNGFVFISGQIALRDGELLTGSVADQTHQIMKNLKTILEKNDLSFQDVVKATIYTTDMSVYSEFNEVYMSYFSSHPPAREMIGVKELPLGATLEISMIAAK